MRGSTDEYPCSNALRFAGALLPKMRKTKGEIRRWYEESYLGEYCAVDAVMISMPNSAKVCILISFEKLSWLPGISIVYTLSFVMKFYGIVRIPLCPYRHIYCKQGIDYSDLV